MTPWRDCGNERCRQCRWRREAVPPDSGHPEPFPMRLLGAAALTLLFVFAFMLLPILMCPAVPK